MTFFRNIRFRFLWLPFLCLLYFPSVANFIWADEPPDDPLKRITRIDALPDGCLIVVTGESCGVFYSCESGLRWKRAEGLPDGEIVVSMARDTAGALYVSTSKGLFRSDDSGMSWAKASDLNTAFLACSPDGGTCYFKEWGKGLFKAPLKIFGKKDKENATYAGREQATDPESASSRHIAPSGSTDGFSQGAGSAGDILNHFGQWPMAPVKLRQSTDPDSRIVPATAGLPDMPVKCLLALSDEHVYAGFFEDGVYCSQDGGGRWLPANENLSCPKVLVLGAGPDGTVFAGTYGGGLHRLPSGQKSWSPVAPEMAREIVQCLAFSENGTMAAGTREKGLFISEDNGRTWFQAEGPGSRANVHASAIDRENHIYIGAYGQGLFVSSDLGKSWTPRPFADLSHVSGLAAGPDETWYILVKGLGLAISRDQGNTLQPVALPFSQGNFSRIAADKKGRLFAGSFDYGAYCLEKSDSGWKKCMDGFPTKGIGDLAADEHGTVYAASADGDGLFRLNDRDVWEKVIADDAYGDNYTCWGIRFFPGTDGVAYGLQDILIADKDSGGWHRTRMGQHYRSLWMSPDGRIWTERMISAFFLDKDGQWRTGEKSGHDNYSDFRLIRDRQYAAIRMDGGVHIVEWSENGFERMGSGLETMRVLSLAVSPDGTIMAGTENGLWISADKGVSWNEVELQLRRDSMTTDTNTKTGVEF